MSCRERGILNIDTLVNLVFFVLCYKTKERNQVSRLRKLLWIYGYIQKGNVLFNIFSTLDKKFEKVHGILSPEYSPRTNVEMEAGRREREIARREIVKWTCLKVHLLRGGQNCCFHRALNKQKTRWCVDFYSL